MSENLVLGAAWGYKPDQIKPFAHSLRKHHQGRIGLLVNSSEPELTSFMSAYGIEPILLDENINFSKISVQRFRLYYNYLAQTSCSRVLLCDTRDVVFQADPFPANSPVTSGSSLAFCSEPEFIGNCPTNSYWYSELLGEDELDKVRSKHILCSGTIYGSQQSILDFISLFWAEIGNLVSKKKAFGMCDQALINYLAYNVINDWERFDTMDSAVATLHHSKLLTLNRDGCLVNRDGSVIPVLHQYDRIKPLRSHFIEQALS